DVEVERAAGGDLGAGGGRVDDRPIGGVREPHGADRQRGATGVADAQNVGVVDGVDEAGRVHVIEVLDPVEHELCGRGNAAEVFQAEHRSRRGGFDISDDADDVVRVVRLDVAEGNVVVFRGENIRVGDDAAVGVAQGEE